MELKKQDIYSINIEYLKKYPKAQCLLGGMITYGEKRLIEIYNEANGRQIVFRNGKGHDQINYYFLSPKK